MEVVINRCFGGFGLSEEAYEYLGLKWDGYGFAYNEYEKRTDPKLVECVRELGERANGWAAELRVVYVPDNVDWEIDDYDGLEKIVQVHEEWY